MDEIESLESMMVMVVAVELVKMLVMVTGVLDVVTPVGALPVPKPVLIVPVTVELRWTVLWLVLAGTELVRLEAVTGEAGELDGETLLLMALTPGTKGT